MSSKVFALLLNFAFTVSCTSVTSARNPAQSAKPPEKISFETENFAKVTINTMAYSRSEQKFLAMVTDANNIGYMVLCDTPRFTDGEQLKLGMVSNCQYSKSTQFVAVPQTVDSINRLFPTMFDLEYRMDHSIEQSDKRIEEYESRWIETPFIAGLISGIAGGILVQHALVDLKGAGNRWSGKSGIKAGGGILAIGTGMSLISLAISTALTDYKQVPIVPISENLNKYIQTIVNKKGLTEQQISQLNKIAEDLKSESKFFNFLRRAIERAIYEATTA